MKRIFPSVHESISVEPVQRHFMLSVSQDIGYLQIAMPTSVLDHTSPVASKRKSRWSRFLGIFRQQRKDGHGDSEAKKKHPHDDDDGNFGYEIPDSFANLDEIAAPAPIENRDEDARVYKHRTLEEER